MYASTGAKQDTLIMLIATSIVIPVFTSLKTSPILGFMLTGMVFCKVVNVSNNLMDRWMDGWMNECDYHIFKYTLMQSLIYQNHTHVWYGVYN